MIENNPLSSYELKQVETQINKEANSLVENIPTFMELVVEAVNDDYPI
jgi:hypothetical protein